MAEKEFDVTKHALVPKHSKVSEKEKAETLKRYSINARDLPKIFMTDPAIQHLDVKEGDIIKIIRPSANTGEAIFFRRVSSV